MREIDRPWLLYLSIIALSIWKRVNVYRKCYKWNIDEWEDKKVDLYETVAVSLIKTARM